MNDGRRIVRQVGDDSDVRSGQVQLHGRAIDLDHSAFAHRLGRFIYEAREARGHCVALDVAVSPAGEVAHNVVSREGLAIVPGHALADLQGVLGGVGVGFPAFQQAAFEGAVVIVLHQVFQPAAIDVGNLRPVSQTRVLGALHFHRDADLAADLCFLRLSRGGQADQSIGGDCGQPERGGAGQKLAAAQLAFRIFGYVHLCGRVHPGLVDHVFHSGLPVTFLFCGCGAVALGCRTVGPFQHLTRPGHPQCLLRIFFKLASTTGFDSWRPKATSLCRFPLSAAQKPVSPRGGRPRAIFPSDAGRRG